MFEIETRPTLAALVRCRNLFQQHSIFTGLQSPQIWLVIARCAASKSCFLANLQAPDCARIGLKTTFPHHCSDEVVAQI